MGALMELRHLRYFVAVAEEGSFVTAAERRLHTSQPSLSRQIRDLEVEVGVKLLERQARGVVLLLQAKYSSSTRSWRCRKSTLLPRAGAVPLNPKGERSLSGFLQGPVHSV